MGQHLPAQALDVRDYPYGGVIVREGDECSVFFVVLSGEVQISERGRNIRVLTTFDTFGLDNIIFGKVSPYTARAITDARVASYGPEALDLFIRDNPRMAQSILASLLHQLKQTTRSLADESGSFALESVKVSFYRDGDVIVEEGSSKRDFYRLVSSQGGLRVSQGGREVGRIEKPGEFFGEVACFMDMPQPSTVTSVGDSAVEVYGFNDLDIIAKDNPELMLQMMRAVMNRLRDTNLRQDSHRYYFMSTSSSSNMSKMAYLYIHTIGCQMNEYDSQRVQHILASQGYLRTSDIGKADVIFLNTCSVRAKAEQKVHSYLGRLRRLKNLKPDLKIIVGGCVAQQLGHKLLERFDHLDLVLGTRGVPSVGTLLQRALTESTRLVHVPEVEEPGWNAILDGDHLLPMGVATSVTIMQGCDNFCSYCIVPHVRGRERSRMPEEILREIQTLLQRGAREVLLLGQNVNSYGKGLDGVASFPSLLRMVHENTPIRRIRFTTSHPKDLTDDLIRCFVELPRLCRWLHLPFQSGSDRVLRRMSRGYTAAHYRQLIERLRSACPDIGLTADVMVGFPGEQDDDFQATLQLIREIRFDNLFSFIYSDRPYTAASTFPDKVAGEIKAERLGQLQSIQAEITLEKNRAEIGSIREVLVEGSSRQAEGKQLMGRTEQNRIVNFEGPAALCGEVVEVRILDAFAHSLLGERVDP